MRVLLLSALLAAALVSGLAVALVGAELTR